MTARAEQPASSAHGPVDLLALAWALKDLCYDSWGSDPPRAARAAATLRALHAAGVPAAQADAIGGLADWTAGIAAINRGEMAVAIQDFDTAALALRRAGLPDPAAQTRVPKIMALSMLGQHQAATACARTALGELRALGNVRAMARVSQNLGNLLGRLDAYAEAATHYREAAVLFARLGEHAHSVSADIGLAWSWASMGDFDEALRIYARAAMRAGKQGLTLQSALVDESVALVELARGNYREALAHFESALRLYETLGVPHYIAIAEKQLADAYLELRLLPEALALFEAALGQFEALDLPDEQAGAQAQRGRTLVLLGRSEPAEAAYALAAACFQAQGNAAGAAAVALARAELALSRRQPQAALAFAESAVAGFASTGQAEGQARADVLVAESLLMADQVTPAQRAFEAALVLAQDRQQLQLQVRCHTGLGLCALALGRDRDARAAFEAAIEGFEDQRRALPGDELRRAFLADHLRPYQALLGLALRAGDAGQVLLALDRCRARALSERLDDEAPQPQPEGAPALRQRLNWLLRRVQQLQAEGTESAALSAELRQTEAQLLAGARRARLAQPSTAGLIPGLIPGLTPAGGLDLQSLQAALAPGDALVEYGVLDGELFACICTAGGVQLQRQLSPWPEVLDAVAAARFQIEALRHGAAPVQRHLAVLTQRAQTRLHRLHALVWAPLEPLLRGCQRVIVVPQAQLGGLPFAALSPHDGALPLGESLQLAQAPSASLALRGLRRVPRRPQRVWALGESSRLPQAAAEARAVAGLFEGGISCVGEAATLAALRLHAPAADVLHLACHAQFRSDNPRFSALHLADGALTVDDAEALGLPAGLVVLSACETAMAEHGQGDEQLGLVRAFLVAGAARVVASLWPVDDAVTAGFMAAFYGALRGGLGPAAALARAQSVTRQQHAHPCFWGAFTLHGGW